MAAQKKFNVAIIGYGLSAKVFHIPFINLVPTLNLHTIIQRNPTEKRHHIHMLKLPAASTPRFTMREL
ncbi:hypothetical protein BN1723_004909 [Verticillium longisporum]|uniref:Gfo/Idh/MocA-like oxidoreductase N-terminal domain-containing protein n=1 Tax=Verticillium longisporum TaxID=100787 RepID=A0A0G4N2U8_VERLO|nr:hypothetical protein BN1723_004909 [Verticillium longisporum]